MEEIVKSSHIRERVKHPSKNVSRSFSLKAVRSLFPLQAIMKSLKYIEILQRRAILHAQKAFSTGGVVSSKIWPVSLFERSKVFSDSNVAVLE